MTDAECFFRIVQRIEATESELKGLRAEKKKIEERLILRLQNSDEAQFRLPEATIYMNSTLRCKLPEAKDPTRQRAEIYQVIGFDLYNTNLIELAITNEREFAKRVKEKDAETALKGLVDIYPVYHLKVRRRDNGE